MRTNLHACLFSVLAGLALILSSPPGHAEERVRPLIVADIDDRALVTLEGNTRPEVTAANDRGAIADATPLDHMTLLLKRSPEREAALDTMIDALHDPASPYYHRWLEADQIGADYGPAPSDRAKITHWLTGHGFKVNFVRANGMIIDFSGTASQLRTTFHTELHRLDVAGKRHVANVSDPQIPAALVPAVAGIITLNDFELQPQSEFSPDFAHPCSNGFGTCQAVAPADLATIYNFKPLFEAGITGQGQTIAIIESSNPAKLADWRTFRQKYGLSGYTGGSLRLIHPQPAFGGNDCVNPGISAAEDEAILDAEWLSAAAPSAHIVMAACQGTVTTSGILTAVLNLEEEKPAARPLIISISYGECEANHGATLNGAYVNAFQTAVAGGASIFVSSGDALSTDCDRNLPAAGHGLGVASPASTAYNVAVGGTDFGDTYHNDVSRFWNVGNSPTFSSAKSYVPEIAWNGSCASELVVKHYDAKTSYGPAGFCNDSNESLRSYFAKVEGAGGGPSGCASGAPLAPSIVSGTCKGTPAPAWQTGVPGLPANGVRNLPDVSMFAANRPWGHSYVICATDQGGCIYGWGGTSFSTPIMAGVQALVNQTMKADHGEGNPNVVYYKLAAAEYRSDAGPAGCDASRGNQVGKSCIFRDVTEGDIEAPCTQGSPNCFSQRASVGATSTSASSYRPAYRTAAGWDFATGLGSVNVANLVNAWHTVAP